MEQQLDFTKLPIGTVVYDNAFLGRGKIENIITTVYFPILVRFDNGRVTTYTSDGRFTKGGVRTLSTENYTMPQMKCEIPKRTLKKGDLVVCNMGGGAKRIGVYQHTETNFAMEDVAHVLFDLSKPYSTCTFDPDEIELYEK